jgi:hypothetical protein
LYDQLYSDSAIPSSLLEDTAYPKFDGRILVFYSAVATFHAPSDPCDHHAYQVAF